MRRQIRSLPRRPRPEGGKRRSEAIAPPVPTVSPDPPAPEAAKDLGSGWEEDDDLRRMIEAAYT